MKDFLATFDLETSHKEAEKAKICWICIKKISKETKSIVSVFNRYVNPIIDIDPESEKVHGLSNNFLSNHLTFKEIAPFVVDFLEDVDIINGYNIVNFDIPILQKELDDADIDFVITTKMKILDSFNIFKRDTPRNLTAAYKFYTGNDLSGAHDASVDVDATIAVMMKQIEDYSHMSLDRLCDFSLFEKEIFDINNKFYKDSNGDVLFNFGKYKDKKTRIVDKGYIDWILSLDDFPKSSRRILLDSIR